MGSGQKGKPKGRRRAGSDEAHCVDHPLADMEQRRFLRIHRAVLLNTAWVREVLNQPSGNLVLRLADARGTELEVPKGRAKEVRSGLGI